MEETPGRTPELSLKDTFLRAVAGLPEEDVRAAVVAEALGYLQQGFDAHYARGEATDDDVLVGDNAGRIAAGETVSLQMWTPHLAELLDIISGEGEERSEVRIREAAGEL